VRVVSLFSGAGGLDLGFLQEGHELIWANENYKDAFDTYHKNLGDHIVFGDIRDIPSSEIPECDIVIGGFPCQGFSIANAKRSEKDSRNRLYLEFPRVIRDKKPKYFLAENVKGLVSLCKGKVLEMIVGDFVRAGYHIKHKVLDAANYGVPQHRERIIFIGIRKDLHEEIEFPEPTHSDPSLSASFQKKPWVSVGEALYNIPEPDDAPTLPNHTYSKYKLRFNNYLGHRRVDPNRPSPTITARGDDRGGVVVIHHPSNKRRMSARELAIVQSFPIDYAFCGCRSSVYRQVANAVPYLMAKALASIFPKT